MRRLVVPIEIVQDGKVLLEGEPFHHLFRVLRMKSGEELLLLDGRGGFYRCRVVSVEKRQAHLDVAEKWHEEEKVVPIRLIQGLPKADKFEWILQKSTEVGVMAFAPVKTERSILSADSCNAHRRMQRWRRIVDEAACQCRRCRVPEIEPTSGLARALTTTEQELRLVCWEEASLPLGKVLPLVSPSSVAVLIGPEGGLSPSEIALAQEHGFQQVSLGARILRTETAGIVLVSWLQFMYGDMG